MIVRTFPAGAAAADITISVPKPLLLSVSTLTASNTTLTTTQPVFHNGLVGQAVSGIGIPAGTTVASVQSATSLTLSQAATDATTNVRNIGGVSINSVKNSTTTVTSAALFGSVFVGMNVTGPGIPDGTTVTAVASQSSITLSAAATDSNTNTLCFHYLKCIWEIVSIVARFTTDANAANRFTRLNIDDGASVYWTNQNDVAQVASVVCDFFVSQNAVIQVVPSTSATARVYGLPNRFRMGPGHRFITTTSSKQATDAWSNIVFLIEEQPNL